MKVLHVCAPKAVPMQNIFDTYRKQFQRRGVEADLSFTGDHVKEYDLVHGHYALTKPVIGAYRSAKRNGIPFVLHCHGSDIRSITSRGAMKLPLKYRLVSGRLRKKAHRVILSTPDLPEWSHGTYLPNPVDVEMFRPTGREKCGRILLLGRFTTQGGILELISPEKSYDCLNWGEDISFPNNVRKLPFTPHEKLPELLNRYHEMIGALVDPVSLARLEAMACGLKTYTNFPKDLLQYYGFEDPDETEDPRGFIERYHHPGKIMDVLFDIYDSLL